MHSAKTLGAAAALFLTSLPAAAQQFDVYGDGKYGVAGCGLGSLLFGNKPGIVQVVAATFNATSGNQTFGITTGTSNCGRGIFQAEQEDFVTGNLASLKKEAAQGGGETLVAYATTLGCSVSSLSTFYSAVQSAHASVFQDDVPAQVVRRTKVEIRHQPALAAACRKA